MADFESSHQGIPIDILAAGGVETGTNHQQFDTALGVASGSETDILSYTVPGDANAFNLERIELNGTNFGIFRVYLTPAPNPDPNPEVQIAQTVTYFGKLDGLVEFDTNDSAKQTLNPGDVLRVSVEHSRPYPGDFSARLQGQLLT